jgi:hypothetical protein
VQEALAVLRDPATTFTMAFRMDVARSTQLQSREPDGDDHSGMNPFAPRAIGLRVHSSIQWPSQKHR